MVEQQTLKTLLLLKEAFAERSKRRYLLVGGSNPLGLTSGVNMKNYSAKNIRETMFCPVHKTMMPIDPATGKRACPICSGKVNPTTKEVPAEKIGSSNRTRLKSASRRVEEEQDKSRETDTDDENFEAPLKPAYPKNDLLLSLYLIDGRLIRHRVDKNTVSYLEVSCERGFKFFANAIDLNKGDYSIERVVEDFCDMCHKRKCTFILSQKEMGRYVLQMQNYKKTVKGQ